MGTPCDNAHGLHPASSDTGSAAPLTIAHVLASTGWGGAERLACTLARFARDAGHRVVIEAPPHPEIRRGVAEELGIELEERPAEQCLARWALAARARVRRAAPELVHVHLAWPRFGAATALVAGALPSVLTFHLLPAAPRFRGDYLLRLPSELVIRATRRLCPTRALVAVSARDHERLKALFPHDAVHLVRNAAPLPRPGASHTLAVAWPRDHARLLTVGRLHAQKGFDRLLTALSAPEARELPWHWLVIGDGEQRAELESRVRTAGLDEKVTFAGAIPAEQAISTADLLVAPSRWEGMPLVPLEALEANTAVVASRIAPHEEIFGGVPGALLPEDERAWPAVLAALIRDPESRRRLREAQSRLRLDFGRARLWREYEALYRSVLAR
ncbi:MAG: glycosyltransferase family 4 protein [Pseudomonadota bacterium]|nr:MAG: hypothetical protein DIU78_08465 [Pseudomonadota bacterium]